MAMPLLLIETEPLKAYADDCDITLIIDAGGDVIPFGVLSV
jgi:hypothetical protein